MTIELYPIEVTNRNVPPDVYVVADVSRMSGEIHDTYYITCDGSMCVVGDWVTDKPRPAYMSQLCRLTGDSEQMIAVRAKSWFYRHDYEGR